MRIPLDLYQILGVPIQATPEQIEQAFADRCQQLPRQEYSKGAIAARTQLLQDAYAVLSDVDTRAAYDQSILAEAATSAEPEGMDLQESQLVGALLLLQEQSDYERIAQLGSAYLQQSIDLNRLPSASAGSDEDVILTMALANLEAGRECWQQKQFEKASDVLQSGLKLLTQEQLFPTVQREIELDLFKLRPYHILELLAAPETETTQRQQGFILLQSMLDERGGIDGQQDDASGLNVDDFLRFIQQLRCHLTVQEQEDFFAKESTRPSAVATYLLVYALIAKGCSLGQPEYIQQAKTALTKLADRQDIHVEKAMCYLLLGQPGAAIQTLPLSRDQESLEFIHQYSEGAEDLVPGLFLYTERWIQQEVYPYFRDLAETHFSLQNYFNDEGIQDYLNALVPEPVSPRMPAVTTPTDLPLLAQKRPKTLNATQDGRLSAQTARQVQEKQLPLRPKRQSVGQDAVSPKIRTEAARQQLTPLTRSTQTPVMPADVGARSTSNEDQGHDNSLANGAPSELRQPSRRSRSQLQYRRWFFVASAVLLGLLGIFGLVSQCSRPESPAPEAENPPVEPPPSVSLGPTPRVSPTPSVSPRPTSTPQANPTPSVVTSDKITTTDARQMIQIWQQTKAKAMGEKHQIDEFEKILAEPSLSDWQQSAQTYKANQSHLQYTFDDLKINAIRPKSATQVAVVATVKETAKVLEQGQLSPASYKEDTYRVRYELIRNQDEWKIQDMTVLD